MAENDKQEGDRYQQDQIFRDQASIGAVDIEELIGEEIDAPIGLGFDLVEEQGLYANLDPSEDGR